MKVNINKIKDSKYINHNTHEKLKLIICNYNNSCQYDNAWDEYTMMCRGLIIDYGGNIIARPFKKFFNLNQREESKIENLPLEKPIIYEKLDGSLGIQYYDGNNVCIATRGSFNSEQAKWATQWIQRRYTRDIFKQEYTYLYEIIYPENRIVVNYKNKQELVLLAIINTKTGKEGDFISEAKRLGLNYPKVINNNLKNIIKLTGKLSAEKEGFVIKYSNGFRVKIKGEEYLRLHRLITGFSTKSIWDCLRNNQNIDEILEKVPDEFYNWVKEKQNGLQNKYSKILNETNIAYQKIKKLPDRRTQAIVTIKKYPQIKSYIFSLLDNKKPDIWKSLKPKYELPFKEIK